MKLVSHTDVQAAGAGGTLHVDPDSVLTPLAEEEAMRLGVQLRRDGAAQGVPTALIQDVSRQVMARLGDASPETLEAVVGEVVAALAGAGSVVGRETLSPGIDYCAKCLDQERAHARRRAVITTTGRNAKGIVATITARIAELGGDILDISQTLVGDYFTMIIVVDTATLDVPFADFKRQLEESVHALGLGCMMMHEDVVTTLHRI